MSNAWSKESAARRRVPSFVWMWALEEALKEHNWKRARKAVGQLRKRGFEVKVVAAGNAELQKGAGI